MPKASQLIRTGSGPGKATDRGVVIATTYDVKKVASVTTLKNLLREVTIDERKLGSQTRVSIAMRSRFEWKNLGRVLVSVPSVRPRCSLCLGSGSYLTCMVLATSRTTSLPLRISSTEGSILTSGVMPTPSNDEPSGKNMRLLPTKKDIPLPKSKT